jgi:hypothetical protein
MRFRRRHEHQWISVSANNSYVRHFTSAATGQPAQMEITLVLRRCRCGAHDTVELDGKWTREELGINDETVRDLMRLLNETQPGDA